MLYGVVLNIEPKSPPRVQSLEMVLVSIVTAAFNAMARPHIGEHLGLGEREVAGLRRCCGQGEMNLGSDDEIARRSDRDAELWAGKIGEDCRILADAFGRGAKPRDAARVLLATVRKVDSRDIDAGPQGRFECRLKDQDASMADMEVHEHVIVEGKSARLKHALRHHNVESISRYIQKHDEYSNWDARVWLEGEANSAELPPSLSGNQAQRRRWLRKRLFALPGSSLLLFIYRYFFLLGFLDGVPGLIYCGFQGIQFLHIKAKIFELRSRKD
jgi:hypothetical protein